MTNTENALKRLASINNLPTLPIVIEKIGQATRAPNANAATLARIIEDDPAIMARILKVANSVLYAGSVQITSVQMAVARLGMNALSNIALSTAVFSTFDDEDNVGFNRQEFWHHSICTGIAAAVVCRKVTAKMTSRYSRDILHLFGLLHDIGRIVFIQYFDKEFEEVLSRHQQDQQPLQEVEHNLIGLDHTQSGAWLSTKWKLAEDIKQVITWHHNPDGAGEQYWEAAALVHTANYICNMEKIGNSGDAKPVFLPEVWKRLGLTLDDILEIVDQVHEESAQSEILMSFV